jgi:hypothetical protein
MDRSVPLRKPWFPFIKLSLAFTLMVSMFYFSLQLFNPHIELEGQGPAVKTAKQKQIEWMLKMFQSKNKK